MVAIFKTGSSINQTLNYNEHKVQKDVAECIMAENYPIDYLKLTFEQKLNRLENQAALNENVTRNSVHISLNFDPSEQLSEEQLKEIATSYMQQIGFGEQPYLVYRHHDAGHPHIHIVSVKVDATGKRIDTQNIGKNQSEKARKDIEIRFGLVKAEDSKNKNLYKLQPVNAQKVQYGKLDTKRAISNVLASVLDSYKYASLPELNALLKLYNITADRGSETSRMYKGNGLMFRTVDDQGKKIGAPVKASQFYMKPTLKKLEQKFLKNEVLKHPLRGRIKNAIDMALFKQNLSIHNLIKTLEKDGINTVLRQNDEGHIYGITYIDHKNKVVFNGSDLGKQYSAKAILERCAQSSPFTKGGGLAMGKDRSSERRTGKGMEGSLSTSSHELSGSTEKGLFEILTQSEQTFEQVPHQLKKTRRKRRRRSQDNR